MDTNSEIIPAWARIKHETLNIFYAANYLLSEYRKVILQKKSDAQLVFVKERIWSDFVSELIHLYTVTRAEIINSKKVKAETKEMLKDLDKFLLDSSKLGKKEAVKLFLSMQDALYQTGLLKVAIPTIEPSEAALEGVEI